MKIRRLGPTRALIGISILLIGGASAFAVTSSDNGRDIRRATSPTGEEFPISRAVDPASLVFRGKVGASDAYLAQGAGPAAGMTCLVLSAGDITRTACDTSEAVEARGLVLSEDVPGGRLGVTGYIPGGLITAPSSLLEASGDLFSGVVPNDLPTVAVQRDGRDATITIPGAGR